MDEQEREYSQRLKRLPLFDERRVAKDRRQFWRDKAAQDRRDSHD